ARKWQQTAGDIGHAFLIRALASAGRSDILHRVYSRTEVGSYGGILARGLATMPETWDAIMDGVQSLNHCMLGHVVEWYYGYVGGIRQAPESVGWKSTVIQPYPGPLLNASCTVKTPLGVTKSAWSKSAGKFLLKVEIPKGMAAVAILPSGSRIELREGRSSHTERS
ncbi:MAG: alpha-L-rhamnosidase C-terminal domain-containing protein, partial [Fimbriimonadaceae bacterium]